MKSEWTMFRTSIVEAPSKSCGLKVVSACQLMTRELVKVKKEAFCAGLSHGSPERADRY